MTGDWRVGTKRKPVKRAARRRGKSEPKPPMTRTEAFYAAWGRVIHASPHYGANARWTIRRLPLLSALLVPKGFAAFSGYSIGEAPEPDPCGSTVRP